MSSLAKHFPLTAELRRKKKKMQKLLSLAQWGGVGVLQWHLQFDDVSVCSGQHGETLRRKGISKARVGGLW